MVYSTRRFVLCLTLCYFVLVFFSPFSIAITSLGEERANVSAFRTFVRFVLVWFCWFSLPHGVWEGLQFVIVALPGLFSYLFLLYCVSENQHPHAYHFLYLSIFFFLSNKIFRQRFLWATAPRILKFGTNIYYDLLYRVRENQHPHANHSLYLSFFFALQ